MKTVQDRAMGLRFFRLSCIRTDLVTGFAGWIGRSGKMRSGDKKGGKLEDEGGRGSTGEGRGKDEW